MMRRKAFTLIEMLVVVVIVGVILSSAVAPMVLTIRNLRITESDFGSTEAMWKSLDFVGRDIRQSIPCSSGPVFRLLEGDTVENGGLADDVVCFMASPELIPGSIPGAALYMIVSDKVEIPGLYRITYPAVKPAEVDCGRIPEKGIQLILPYADSLRISVWDGKSWVEEYTGPRPAGINIALGRRGEVVEYVDWIPK